jgi:septal ring factor EnvC (AmiA/AmiB activator)
LNLNRIRILLVIFVFLFQVIGNIKAQNYKDLDKRKQDNIQQLSLSKSLLEKTSQSKSFSINQVSLIQQSIEYRTKLVENIGLELSFLENDMEANSKQISNIQIRIKTIKKEYARYIISASRNLDEDFALMYLFSSQDFNQAYQRIKYLKYLARYRSDLVENLKIEEENLKRENLELASNRKKNERLLSERKSELNSLAVDKKKNLSLIMSLQNRELELKKEIQKRERIQDEIEKEIRKIIEEEARKAKELKKMNVLTPEERIISNDFSRNIGKLPWPSEHGILTGKFGEQNHPVLKGIKIRSNGIDIATEEGTKVRCVFDGEVTKVIAILGANYTVIIKHGEFRTVYQNLVDVKVKAGDRVKIKTIIGTVYTDEDKVSKFHFEIWRDKIIQNPEIWLSD